MRPRFRGEIYVLLAALLWSTSGIGVKVLDGYSPLATSAGRSLVCGLFFLGLTRGRLLLPKGTRLWAGAGALTYALTVISFVFATRYTTAANAIILQYTAPLWIAVLGWLVLRERPSAREVAAMIAGGAGVIFCLGKGLTLFASERILTKALLGDAISLSSGLAFAGCIIVLRRINKGRPPETGERVPVALICMAYGNLLAVLVGAPALLAEFSNPGIPGHPPVLGWLVLLWLGIGQLGGGYWCFQRGLRSTRALTASLIALIEPVINPVWVALLVGEIPSRGTLIGGLLVLTAVILCLSDAANNSNSRGR